MRKKLSVLLLTLCMMLNCFGIYAYADEEGFNLAEGLSYKISTGEPVTMSYALFSQDGINYDEDNGQLTDSKTAMTSQVSNGWYRSYKGKSRVVSFDLGQVCSITRVEAGFLHSKQAQIYAPRYIKVLLSHDGVEYGTVTEYETGFDISTELVSRQEFTVDFGATYSARYVKVIYSCDVFSYCDEIRIIGEKILFGGEKTVTPDKDTAKGGYQTEHSGNKNIVKLYNGSVNKASALNEDALIPYVAYVGADGNISGMMFDSVAFVPDKNAIIDTSAISDWETYLENTFKAGQDVDALNQTAGKVYSHLNIEQKMGVYLTIPFVAPSDIPFGDINGDGMIDGRSTVEERYAIVEWYINQCTKLFLRGMYDNLKLSGFIWGNDEISLSVSKDEYDFISRSNAYLKEKRLYLITEFGYLSEGFDESGELGLTGAVMRPEAFGSATDENYYFDPAMIEEFAYTAKNNGLGVGIETDSVAAFTGENYRKAGKEYENYLFGGYKNGYINALKIFSQGEGKGAFYEFCHTDISTPRGRYLRRLYDLTYQFIHGVYKNDAPIVSIPDMEMYVGDSSITTAISISDADSYREDIVIEFAIEPQNGSVAVAADGSTLIYRANEGFIGSDSFTVRVSDGFNYSEPATVIVTVSEPEPIVSEGDVSDTLSDESKQDSDDLTGNTDDKLIIMLVCGLSAVIVLIVIVSKIKRSRASKKRRR